MTIVYAIATPRGPKGRPAANAITWQRALNSPHRIQRSDRPAATWSHPSVRSTLLAMPRTAKTHSRGPVGAHFCPSNSTTKSCPVTASVAKIATETKLTNDSAEAHDRLSSPKSSLSLLSPDDATLCKGSVRMLSTLL